MMWYVRFEYFDQDAFDTPPASPQAPPHPAPSTQASDMVWHDFGKKAQLKYTYRHIEHIK